MTTIYFRFASDYARQLYGSSLKRATPGSAGLDLRACIEQPRVLEPGAASVLIPTGLYVSLERVDRAALLLPRSGMGHKKGLVLGNSVGLIDSDYAGEWLVSACVRPGHDPVTINPGDAIAQAVIIPVIHASIEEEEELSQVVSERGAGGFGSTGN